MTQIEHKPTNVIVLNGNKKWTKWMVFFYFCILQAKPQGKNYLKQSSLESQRWQDKDILLTLNITNTIAANPDFSTTDVLLLSDKLESVHSTSLFRKCVCSKQANLRFGEDKSTTLK